MDSVSRNGGLILLWKYNWNLSARSLPQGHNIDVVITMENSLCWQFTRFYGCPDANKREESWKLLRRLNGLFDLPWVCGGDFN